jgi:hypothetical protein
MDEDMESDPEGLQALAEAEWLQEMFETCALQAAERRIAYSIDRSNIANAMYFLEVYRFVNGGDILGVPPITPVAAAAAND